MATVHLELRESCFRMPKPPCRRKTGCCTELGTGRSFCLSDNRKSRDSTGSSRCRGPHHHRRRRIGPLLPRRPHYGITGDRQFRWTKPGHETSNTLNAAAATRVPFAL